MSCEIHNKSNYDISGMKPLVQDMYSFADKRFGFNKPPSINFVSDSNNHPLLGKTAHYDPSSMEIVVYADGRHPKDMMRSIAHELVHHKQNLDGHFDGESACGAQYAQKDPHLRKMEKQAYLQGNMCFRDWEDGYKAQHKDIFYERRIRKMSIKKWKDNELNTLLNERWGFSMDLNKLNENKMPMKDEPPGEDLNDDGKKGHGKVPAFLEEEEVEEDLTKLKGGLKDYMMKKQGKEDNDEEKEEQNEIKMGLMSDDIPAALKKATVKELEAALKAKKEEKDDKKDS